MIDDFPTAWSPKKTILYLRRGGMVPLDRFKLLMLVVIFKLYHHVCFDCWRSSFLGNIAVHGCPAKGSRWRVDLAVSIKLPWQLFEYGKQFSTVHVRIRIVRDSIDCMLTFEILFLCMTVKGSEKKSITRKEVDYVKTCIKNERTELKNHVLLFFFKFM